MNFLYRIRRYVALQTYEIRQTWRHFSEDVRELWQYWCPRFGHRLHSAWPFRVLSRLLAKRVPRSRRFGRFGGKAMMDATFTHAVTSDKYEFENVYKTFGDAVANARGDKMTIPFERTRALVKTKEFLTELADPDRAPRYQAELQRIALTLLRHYPTYADIEQAHKVLPELYGPVPPFSRAHAKTAITELGLDKLGPQDGD